MKIETKHVNGIVVGYYLVGNNLYYKFDWVDKEINRLDLVCIEDAPGLQIGDSVTDILYRTASGCYVHDYYEAEVTYTDKLEQEALIAGYEACKNPISRWWYCFTHSFDPTCRDTYDL